MGLQKLPDNKFFHDRHNSGRDYRRLEPADFVPESVSHDQKAFSDSHWSHPTAEVVYLEMLTIPTFIRTYDASENKGRI